MVWAFCLFFNSTTDQTTGPIFAEISKSENYSNDSETWKQVTRTVSGYSCKLKAKKERDNRKKYRKPTS